eukprot:2403846-Pleurochrysis_carterae.AAC.7
MISSASPKRTDLAARMECGASAAGKASSTLTLPVLRAGLETGVAVGLSSCDVGLTSCDVGRCYSVLELISILVILYRHGEFSRHFLCDESELFAPSVIPIIGVANVHAQ